MYNEEKKVKLESEEYTGAFLPTGDMKESQEDRRSVLQDEEPFFEYACVAYDQEMK